MNYDLKKPCSDCPFKRGTAMRLTRERAKEIAGMMLSSNGGIFPCHKTTIESDDGDGEMIVTQKSKHCAGALIFAEKNGVSTQMMRIAERLGMYDAKVMADQETVNSVFSSGREMVKHMTRKTV